MEEERMKYPSLPSNYVSLVQLQERWLKEKERNQRDDEERELRKQSKEEDKTDNWSLRENVKGKKAANTESSSSRRRTNDYRRYQSEKSFQWMESSKPKSEESLIEAVEDHNQDGKTNYLRKKKWKWKNKRKPRAEGTAQLVQENQTAKNIPVIMQVVNERHRSELGEKGGDVKVKGSVVQQKVIGENATGDSTTLPPEKEAKDIPVVQAGIRSEDRRFISEYRPNGDDCMMKIKVWEEKGPKDHALEVERKFRNLALDSETGNNMRFRAEDGGKWRYRRGSGRFARPRMWKQTDDSYVWVKKGEISNSMFPKEKAQASGGALVSADNLY